VVFDIPARAAVFLRRIICAAKCRVGEWNKQKEAERLVNASGV
jgi:hypothetical protein